MKRVNRVLSFRLLMLLGVAVLLVHLALLRGTSLNLSLPQTEPSQVFSTRAIELPATRVPPVRQAPRPAPATPVQSQPAQPSLAEAESPASAAAETPTGCHQGSCPRSISVLEAGPEEPT